MFSKFQTRKNSCNNVQERNANGGKGTLIAEHAFRAWCTSRMCVRDGVNLVAGPSDASMLPMKSLITAMADTCELHLSACEILHRRSGDPKAAITGSLQGGRPPRSPGCTLRHTTLPCRTCEL